jgi:hypothetical protein
MKKIIGVFSLLLLIFVLGGCSKSDSKITQSNNASLNNQPTLNLDNADLTLKCDADAKNYFDSKWQSKTVDTDVYKTINLSYQNHYDKTNNSCYILISYNFKTYRQAAGAGPDYMSTTFTFLDIYRKDQNENPLGVGGFNENISHSDGSANQLVQCNAFGQNCSSIEEFLSIVNPYIGK